MSVLESVGGLFRRDDAVYECRRCGTTVEADDEACPCCEAVDIARYRIR